MYDTDAAVSGFAWPEFDQQRAELADVLVDFDPLTQPLSRMPSHVPRHIDVNYQLPERNSESSSPHD